MILNKIIKRLFCKRDRQSIDAYQLEQYAYRVIVPVVVDDLRDLGITSQQPAVMNPIAADIADCFFFDE